FAEELRYSLDLHTCEATAHMIRMRVSDKSVSDLNLVLCRNAKDLVDPPRAVHHRNFACLCRADEIDKILHRTHFDLFEVEPAVHVTKLEVRSEVRSRWESGVRPLTSVPQRVFAASDS